MKNLSAICFGSNRNCHPPTWTEITPEIPLSTLEPKVIYMLGLHFKYWASERCVWHKDLGTSTVRTLTGLNCTLITVFWQSHTTVWVDLSSRRGILSTMIGNVVLLLQICWTRMWCWIVICPSIPCKIIWQGSGWSKVTMKYQHSLHARSGQLTTKNWCVLILLIDTLSSLCCNCSM